MSIAERLDEALDAPVAPDESQPWQITDPGSADWCLRKLAKVEAEQRQIETLAEEQIAAIVAWRSSELERIAPQKEHWSALLSVYHRKRMDADEDVKTIRLPHGTLSARKLPDGIEIQDEAALLDWALEHESRFVRVKESLDKTAIKEAVLKAGEVVPGVTPYVGDVRFSVSTQVEES